MTDKQESLLKLAELFKILGDPTRLKIVELLLENEMCVNHIAETMEMGQCVYCAKHALLHIVKMGKQHTIL